jgi:cell wall-associated NlpC family hydrolase
MRTGAKSRLPGLLAGMAALLLILIVPGCAPKSVRPYESSGTSEMRGSIVDYAVTLLGKPYRNGAKGPDTFDCSGFVYYVYTRFNVAVPVSTAGLNKTGYEVSRDEIFPGDLAIFRISSEYHVGIMINRLEFVHASKSRGVAIDSVDATYWKKYFSHFRRVL